MYYIVSEICIGGHFLEDWFYCYSQQIESAVAAESLVPCNITKREPYFFWGENCYYWLETWHILCNLKTFKEAIKTFWIWCGIFNEVIIYQHFQQVTLQTLVVFFICFSTFCEFQCHFYRNTFVLTFIIKYFTSFWFEGGQNT